MQVLGRIGGFLWSLIFCVGFVEYLWSLKYSQDPPLIQWDYRRLDAISQTGVVRNGSEVVVRLVLRTNQTQGCKLSRAISFWILKVSPRCTLSIWVHTYPRGERVLRRLSLRHHIKSSPWLVASTSRRGLSSLSTALRAQLYRSCIYVCLFGYGFWFS